MSDVTKTILIGNLGEDPERVTLNNGGTAVNVSLATTETWPDANGERQEHTEWHKLVAYNGRAKALLNCGKGSKLYIEGRNRTEKYTDKKGINRTVTKVTVDDVKFLKIKEPTSHHTGEMSNTPANANGNAGQVMAEPSPYYSQGYQGQPMQNAGFQGQPHGTPVPVQNYLAPGQVSVQNNGTAGQSMPVQETQAYTNGNNGTANTQAAQYQAVSRGK